MANQFSNIAQIMGNRGMQQAAPAPTDPRQQTMMQQLGITNPLLQQFGQQIGNLAGVDMRSAAQQTASGLQGLDPSDPKSLLGVAQAIQSSDPEKAALLRAKAAEIKASQVSQEPKAKDRYIVAGGNKIFDTVERKFVQSAEAGDSEMTVEEQNKEAELLADHLKTNAYRYTPASVSKALSTNSFEALVSTAADKEAKGGDAEGDQERIATIQSNAQQAIDTIDKALQIAPESGSEAFLNAITQISPFSEARDLNGYVQTLQSKLAFDRLQEMRNASKTGGALGQVSNIELGLLQSNLAALDPYAKNFKDQLKVVKNHYQRFIDAINGTSSVLTNNVTEVDGKQYYKGGDGQWYEVTTAKE